MSVPQIFLYINSTPSSSYVVILSQAYHRLWRGLPRSERSPTVIDVVENRGPAAIMPETQWPLLNIFPENSDKRKIMTRCFFRSTISNLKNYGLKGTSKKIMSDAGVPVVGGYHGDDQSDEKLCKEAHNIGFPVMIKAVRGGGGKGMRIALTPEEFDAQLDSARREAQKSFGDQVMLIEKYVERPRHVEVQVFGDQHGNYVYLFERDCSVQRRHQKIIEEAPAPGLTWEERRSIGEAACRAAKAVNYVGAGTVEFILDAQHKFYFMEMNTRLQVEHPISEMITDTDLVEWQIRVASGETLPKMQDEIKLSGHSFEARIYAEDPKGGFLPGAGPLNYLATPVASPTVRIETGVRQGDEVSIHYDPMIAKLVVWGQDRNQALNSLTTCLADYNIVGLNTNVNFLMDLAKHPSFVSGDVHTDFIPEHYDSLFPERSPSHHLLCQAALAMVLQEEAVGIKAAAASLDPTSPFKQGVLPRINHILRRSVNLSYDGKDESALVEYLGNAEYRMTVGGSSYTVSGSLVTLDGFQLLSCSIDGAISNSRVIMDQRDINVFTENGGWKLSIPGPKFESELSKGGAASGDAVAPMPGVVEKVCVEAGQTVQPGDPLIIMIAMKMEYVIRAPKAGTVEKVLYKAGDNVAKNSPLVNVKEDEES
ncbi:unnamed protein product, partial [Meganyctiphanes norvegica]